MCEIESARIPISILKKGDTADVYTDPDLAAERAAEYVARGFTAVKFDPARAILRRTILDSCPAQCCQDQKRLSGKFVRQ